MTHPSYTLLLDHMTDIMKNKERQRAKEQSGIDVDVIEGVMDGKLYKERFDSDGFYRGSDGAIMKECHLSLQGNNDGVSLFQSSTYQVWPVYFTINELPPHLRYVTLSAPCILKMKMPECSRTSRVGNI